MSDTIINLFGNQLAQLIGKPSLACKGLLRFSIREYMKTNGFEEDKPVTYTEFLTIIHNYLKNRLILAKIENIDDVLMELETIVNIEQAIFSMST